MKIKPFHLAVPVNDIREARQFYGTCLGFEEGRSSDLWIDWDFYGHQVVTHFQEGYEGNKHFNPVDGHEVPVPHFGVVLDGQAWTKLADRLRSIDIDFIIEPHTRFKGQVGEQSTMFFLDPSGNALEFKAFADMSQLFAR